MDLTCQKTGASEFPTDQTHGIALWPKHRLVFDSRGLGWRDVYTSLAIEADWRRTLPAIPHVCLAYCHHGAASVSRRISGDATLLVGELRPRLFGIVPESRDSLWNLRGRPGIQLVYLRRELVETLAAEVFGLDAHRLSVEPRLAFADPMLEQLTLELAAAAQGGVADRLYADQLAQTITLRVLRAHLARPGAAPRSLAPEGQPRIRRVRDFIETALGEDLSLERLASEAGLGAHAFAREFRRATGSAPHRYLLERRIERAKTLLRERALPLADIALQCGFASQSHFSAAFRRFVGATPKQFRFDG
jgi:AraC family transcriptional regulator